MRSDRLPPWIDTAIRGMTYRLILAAAFLGVLGALSALLFDYAVKIAESNLLERIAGYVPPAVGMLHPVPDIPGFPARFWIPVVAVLGALVSGFIVYRWAPAAEGHGTDAAISAYHQRPGDVSWKLPVVKLVSSALIIGSGGVAGREGPTAQIASSMGSIIIRKMGFQGAEFRSLLLAGMAAGLSAVFRAPLGMAIFAVEILYSGMAFEGEGLILTVIASVVAYAVHGFFVGWEPLFAIPGGLSFHNPVTLLGYGGLGIIAGLFGAALPFVFYRVRDLCDGARLPRTFRPALGALGVGVIALWRPEVIGTGYGWVERAITGDIALATIAMLVLLKVPAMALTIGSGGSGGVFGPTITVGALLGALVGNGLVHLFPDAGYSVPAFVIVGMAGVFAGAARTPISTLIMVAEMTNGYALIVPTMLTVVIAFEVQRVLTAGAKYPTLYESQVLNSYHSPAHQGVLVRRAFELLDVGAVDRGQVTLPRVVSLLRFGEPVPFGAGDTALVRVPVTEGGEFAGRTIGESVGALDNVTAVAVLRDGGVLIPRGPTRLQPGDELVLLASRKAHEELAARS